MKLSEARSALAAATDKVREAEEAQAQARDGVNAALADLGWYDDGTIMAPGVERRFRNAGYARSLHVDEIVALIEQQKRALA